MATPWTFKQRLAAYRAAGITKIVVMRNAENHNRDSATGRYFGPVYGLLVHHTAGVGSGMANFVYNGTSRLPGPLAQDFLAKDGTLYVVGHGRCNHAGSTTSAVRSAIIAERSPSNQRDIGGETVDGNDFLYGLEIENWGNGRDPYPAVQYDVAVRWAVAHLKHYGWGPNSAWGHKEITRRKIDPSFDMDKYRRDVGAMLAGGNQEEWEMADFRTEFLSALNDKEVRKALVNAVYRTDDVVTSPPSRTNQDNEYWWVQTHLNEAYDRVTETKSAVDAVKEKVDSLSVGGVDLDALAEKVADLLAARLAD